MKLNKFLAVGCAAALVSMAPSVFAATPKYDSIESNNPACLISLSDTTSVRFINVNQIRLIQIKNSTSKSNTGLDDEDGKTIHVSLVSGKNDSFHDSNIALGYKNKEDAFKALENFRDKINDCQHDAAVRRNNR